MQTTQPRLKLDPVTYARLRPGQRIRFEEGGRTLFIEETLLRKYAVDPMDGSQAQFWPVRTVRAVSGFYQDAPGVQVVVELAWERVVYLESTWGTR